MNRTFILLLFVFLSLEFIESRPRYGSKFWSKYVRSSEESSENDSFESCIDCSYTSIGNGYKNRNIIRYNSHPNNNKNIGQTDMYQEIDEESENEIQSVSQSVTRNGYRTTSKQGYNSFGGNDSQGGYGNNNNHRPFRPEVRQTYESRRPYNNYETNDNRKRTGEIGDFGNGHDNRNTFNIHKKNIYIS